MLSRAMLYTLTNGDVECVLQDASGEEVTLVDLEPSHAAIIKAVREAPHKAREVWDSEQATVLEVEYLQF